MSVNFHTVKVTILLVQLSSTLKYTFLSYIYSATLSLKM
jgi:hypothetical protein